MKMSSKKKALGFVAATMALSLALCGCASSQQTESGDNNAGNKAKSDDDAFAGITLVAAFATAANEEETGPDANRGISENREVGIVKFIDGEKKTAVAQLEIFEEFPRGALLVAWTLDLKPTALLQVETASNRALGLTILRGTPSVGDIVVVPGEALKAKAETLPEP